MRIAQIAPVHESVPPARYGGTERVVHWLTEELFARGHDVVVFGSGDSTTRAELVPVVPRSLRASGERVSAEAMHLIAIERAIRAEPAFDLIHAHVDWPAFGAASRSPVPVVSTMHGRLDGAEAQAMLATYDDVPLVAISDAQRAFAPRANWQATIHHGLRVGSLPFVPTPKPYLAFVGRISREKRPDLAIRAARAAGLPLKIAAKLNGNPEDREYFRRVVEPLIDAGPGVELVGEISEDEKAEFMGQARALLFPVDWPEPFGLVAIEALAFGTPVIARPLGALPEIVEDGRNGFLVDGVDEMVAAIRAVGSISRAACRDSVRRRFTVERMVDQYEAVYRRLARGAVVGEVAETR